MRILAAFLLACAALSAQVQGRLRYQAEGHAPVQLDLVDGGHPALLAIPHLRGDAEGEAVRTFVLTHTGPEAQILPPQVEPKLLRKLAPPAWRVDHAGARALLGTSYAQFWRYTPGLVLPVSFKLGRDTWRLIEADLPPKLLVSNDGD